MPLGMEVGLSPWDFVLDRDPPPLSQKSGGAEPPPQFSANVYCGQTAAWIKMPLVMEVGLSPVDFVLDGDPARLPKKGAELPPQYFGPCGQRAGWIKMALCMGVGLSPVDFVLDGDPAPPQKGWSTLPNFQPISIVAKRLDGSRCHLLRR